jgi:hypothetical protein
MGFDQDLWARMGDYRFRVPHESLALFRLLRNANLQFLKQITPDRGNTLASMPSVAASRSGIWPSIWRATMPITSSKSVPS